MSRVLVIDSLARSGTTLLTALMNSQKDCAGLRAVFHEPLACNIGSWPHGMANLPLMSKRHSIRVVHNEAKNKQSEFNQLPILGKDWLSSLKIKLVYPVILDAGVLLDSTFQRVQDLSQTGLFNESRWQKLLHKRIKSTDDLDSLYQDIINEGQLKIICFRWNQGIFYAQKWLRNVNHYWCAIVRNPMDRAASSYKTHHWPYAKSLKASISYAHKINAMKACKNFKLIYYEDLVNNPEEVLKELFDWLGDSRNEFELQHIVSQHSGRYRSETADDVERHGTHKLGREYEGIYNSAIGRYKQIMIKPEISKYRKKLSNIPIYSRYV